MYGVGDGGVRTFLGFRDLARGENCEPRQLFEEGPLRCTPPIFGEGDVFADAACSKPATRWDTCDPPARYLSKRSPRGVWRVVASRTAFRRDADGTCTAVEAGADETFYVATEAVPLDAFVTYTEHELDVGDRLQPVVYTGSDGSRYAPAETYFDTKLGFRCGWYESTDGVKRCVPGEWIELLWSEGCTTPLAGLPSKSGWVTAPDPCTGARVFRDVGPYAGACARSNGATCKPLTSPCTKARRLTEIAPTELAERRVVSQGGPRLVQDVVVVGAARYPAWIHDTELAFPCWIHGKAGASPRCHPQGSLSRPLFTDSTCSGTPVATSSCSDAYFGGSFVVERSTCDVDGIWRRKGRAITPPATLYEVDRDGACIAEPAAEVLGDSTLHELEPPLDFGTLATGSIVVE